MARLVYIGKKPKKTDRMFTGIVWNHPGDVQEVEDTVASKLLAYKEIWALEGDTPDAPAAEVEVEPEHEHLDPKERMTDINRMHWMHVVQFIKECDIEDLIELREIEVANRQRGAVIKEIDLRLS